MTLCDKLLVIGRKYVLEAAAVGRKLLCKTLSDAIERSQIENAFTPYRSSHCRTKTLGDKIGPYRRIRIDYCWRIEIDLSSSASERNLFRVYLVQFSAHRFATLAVSLQKHEQFAVHHTPYLFGGSKEYQSRTIVV